MKLAQLLKEEIQVQVEDSNVNLDQKGRVQMLAPALEGQGQCPYWKYMKNKLSAGKGEDVQIPKVFVEETAKRFKIPLDPNYSTPICVGGSKICIYFGGLAGGLVNCKWGTQNPKAEPKVEPVGGLQQQPVKNTEEKAIQGEVK